MYYGKKGKLLFPVKYDTIAIEKKVSLVFMKKATLNDVAQFAEVSKTTVSRYLKGENVRPEIAEKIEKAICEIGYTRKEQEVTDKNAENIEKEAVKSFAIFVENMNRGRTRRILDALEKELYARNFLLQIFITKNDPKLEEAYVTYCKDTGIDAIFIEDCSSVSEIQAYAEQKNLPVLFLNEHVEGCSMEMNEVQAGEMMGKYLLERECLSLHYLGSETKRGENRLKGIKNIYQKAHQPIDIVSTLCDGSYSDAFEKIKDIFTKRVDLILLGQEEYGISLSRYAREYHITIPENVSAATFCGYDLANVTSPRLTCVSVDYKVYAEDVMMAMEALLENKPMPEQRNIYTFKLGNSVR